VRPSNASNDGALDRDLDVDRRKSTIRERVELVLAGSSKQEVAEPLGTGGERRQGHTLAPVEARLVDAGQRERRGWVQAEDSTRRRDHEPDLAVGRLWLAVLEVGPRQLA